MDRSLLEPLAHTLLGQYGIDVGLAPALAAALEGCTRKSLAPGQLLCREGEPGAHLWVLISGQIKVKKQDFQGKEQDLTAVKAPTMMGHMSLVDGSPRSATCMADGPASVAEVDHARFQHLMHDPGPEGDVFRRVLIACLAQQLSKGNAQLVRLIDPMAPSPVEEGEARRRLMDTAATFEGWRPL